MKQPTPDVLPDQYSYRVSPNRWKSFQYALAGIVYVLRHQPNIRIITLATGLVIGLALWLEIDLLRWSILIVIMGMVWLAEFVNAAIEAAVNTATQEYHPMAQVSKDVAAGAVLVAVIISIIVGAMLFVPPLLVKLGLR